jgi:hypothetical protein
MPSTGAASGTKAAVKTSKKKGPKAGIGTRVYGRFMSQSNWFLSLKLSVAVLTLASMLVKWQQWSDSVAADPARAVSAPQEEPTFEPLDNKSQIYWADSFLSAAEVDHVIRLVESTGGWHASPTGLGSYDVPRSAPDFLAAVRSDSVLARIERRIARATGVQSHPHEDIVSIARITPLAGVQPRGGHFPPYGLHHDSDTRPARVWTVIVYLKAPQAGGLTIFPLGGLRGHGPDASSELRQRHKNFGSLLTRTHFGGAETGYNRQVSFDKHSDHPFMDLIEDACRGDYGIAVDGRGGEVGSRTRGVTASPPSGAGALMFRSSKRVNWHAGCNVVKGTKIILQKVHAHSALNTDDARAESACSRFVLTLCFRMWTPPCTLAPRLPSCRVDSLSLRFRYALRTSPRRSRSSRSALSTSVRKRRRWPHEPNTNHHTITNVKDERPDTHSRIYGMVSK